jgi:transposase-like protein
MAKTRRTFTREFKIEAIKRITEQGRSLSEVSRDLEIGESTLRSWKQALKPDGTVRRPRARTAPRNSRASLGAERRSTAAASHENHWHGAGVGCEDVIGAGSGRGVGLVW